MPNDAWLPNAIPLMRNDVIVNPPDVLRHVPAPLREAGQIPSPLFSQVVEPDGAARGVTPTAAPKNGKTNDLEFVIASFGSHNLRS